MNGLGTNVLIRYLVAGDEAQVAKAKRYFESGPSYVNCIVLSEAVWVLESAYGYDKEAIVSILERLLSTHDADLPARGGSIRIKREAADRQVSDTGSNILTADSAMSDDAVVRGARPRGRIPCEN